ncbi:MAG TPA: flavin reductase family protein [Rubrivivax sp.]|nr:flavin reductase family protein [Rubrivivax sp.]
MHRAIEPAIHYRGTPVVLISSLNEDGSTNLSPISSAWWLGWSCMLGLDASSKTVENMCRAKACVLNLPSHAMATQVNGLAWTTGSRDLPMHKKLLGYRHEPDRFTRAGLTRAPLAASWPDAVAECPVQLEGEVVQVQPFAATDARLPVAAVAVEVRLLRMHVEESLLVDGCPHRIYADRWHPMIMSFRHLFGRGDKLEKSSLAREPEEAYAPWKQVEAPRRAWT